MIRPFLGFLGLGMALAIPAHAQLTLTNYDGFELRQAGKEWTFSHATAESTRLRGGTSFGSAAATVSTSQPLTVQTSGRIAVGKGAVIDVAAKVTRPSFAKAAIAAAKFGGGIVGGIAGSAAAGYLLDIGITKLMERPDGTLDAAAKRQDQVFGAYVYWLGVGNMPEVVYPSAASACSAHAALLSAESVYRGVNVALVTEGRCYITYQQESFGTWRDGSSNIDVRKQTNVCTSGTVPSAGRCVPVTDRPLTQQELEDFVASNSGWPTSAARALQSILSQPAPRGMLIPDGVQINGPSSVPGETSTSTSSVRVHPGTATEVPPGHSGDSQPGTRTTTRTSSTGMSYNSSSGGSASPSTATATATNVTTNITTNITNNVTNQTDTSTETREEEPEEQAVDTPLGDLPKLYERKYPEGMVGIWNQKKAAMQGTSLLAFLASVMPTGINSGTCPAWTLNVNFGGVMNMGSYPVEVPCWLWDVVKAALIVSALLYARRLIFGG